MMKTIIRKPYLVFENYIEYLEGSNDKLGIWSQKHLLVIPSPR